MYLPNYSKYEWTYLISKGFQGCVVTIPLSSWIRHFNLNHLEAWDVLLLWNCHDLIVLQLTTRVCGGIANVVLQSCWVNQCHGKDEIVWDMISVRPRQNHDSRVQFRHGDCVYSTITKTSKLNFVFTTL